MCFELLFSEYPNEILFLVDTHLPLNSLTS